MYAETIKHATEALKSDSKSAKAYYRLHCAHKSLGDLDKARVNLVKACEIEPNNRNMRSELKKLTEEKEQKEKQWRLKMSGFYQGTKLKQLEENDARD